MLVTAEVSNLLKSRLVRALQPEKVESRFVSKGVLMVLKSTLVRDEHPENIEDMSLTSVDSNPLKSMEVN